MKKTNCNTCPKISGPSFNPEVCADCVKNIRLGKWAGCNCKVETCDSFDTFEADDCETCPDAFKNRTPGARKARRMAAKEAGYCALCSGTGTLTNKRCPNCLGKGE